MRLERVRKRDSGARMEARKLGWRRGMKGGVEKEQGRRGVR